MGSTRRGTKIFVHRSDLWVSRLTVINGVRMIPSSSIQPNKNQDHSILSTKHEEVHRAAERGAPAALREPVRRDHHGHVEAVDEADAVGRAPARPAHAHLRHCHRRRAARRAHEGGRVVALLVVGALDARVARPSPWPSSRPPAGSPSRSCCRWKWWCGTDVTTVAGIKRMANRKRGWWLSGSKRMHACM